MAFKCAVASVQTQALLTDSSLAPLNVFHFVGNVEREAIATYVCTDPFDKCISKWNIN